MIALLLLCRDGGLVFTLEFDTSCISPALLTLTYTEITVTLVGPLLYARVTCLSYN